MSGEPALTDPTTPKGAPMTMDQRWSKRHRLELPVEVVGGTTRLSDCHSRDIGLGGAFVSCRSDALSGREGEEVELIFHLGRGAQSRQHRLRARIVRCETQGAGFAFSDFDTAAFRALQQILHQAIAS